jgi:lipoprotein-anchoring transpeptidase ErfK/SrfK
MRDYFSAWRRFARHSPPSPQTIGHAVSWGCLRLVNDGIADLYARVPVGTKVIVQP